MSVFGVILVLIFPHSHWLRGDTPYLFVSIPNAGKCGPEISTNTDTFTQWEFFKMEYEKNLSSKYQNSSWKRPLKNIILYLEVLPWKYFKIYMFSSREKLKINLKFWHAVLCLNIQYIRILVKSEVIFRRYSESI